MVRKKKEVKRAVIISGGGALGAYGAGTLAALDNDYDLIAGTSTGALMSSLVALKKWDALKVAYTSVTNKEIFDRKWYRPNVFTKKGTLNMFTLLYVLISRVFGRKRSINSLGTTKKLRNLIDKFISQADYDKIRELNKEVVVTALNLNESPSQVHYFSSLCESFEDFKDWSWASANAPFVTTLLEKKWFDHEDQKWYIGEWTDGGLTEVAPFDYVLQQGVGEVDIIMHRVKPKKIKQRSLTQDFLQNVERGIAAMRFDIEYEDDKFAQELLRFAQDNKVTVRVYWIPRVLTSNSLLFDKATMLQWYDEGFATAHDENRIDIYR